CLKRQYHDDEENESHTILFVYEGEILGTSDIKEELKQYYPQNVEEKNNRNRIISTDQRTAIKSSKENNEYKLLNDAIGQQDQILTFVQDIYMAVQTLEKNCITLSKSMDEDAKKLSTIERNSTQCTEKMNALVNMFMSINNNKKKTMATQ
ncbi:unnamed protein product, partial [Didymodactylos carnosus]